MRLPKYTLATAELVLMFPAVLFMTALFARNLQPQQYEPAHTAQQIVNWYALRPHLALWVLLMALPAVVLFTGCAVLFHSWTADLELRTVVRQTAAAIKPHLTTLLIALATLTAAGVLGIVALHVLTD
jgi:hypothetical protein